MTRKLSGLTFHWQLRRIPRNVRVCFRDRFILETDGIPKEARRIIGLITRQIASSFLNYNFSFLKNKLSAKP